MAIYYDLLQLNNQLIGIGLNNSRKLLETPNIIQGFSSYIAQMDADKQDRVPNFYYKQATGSFDATQTYYIWGNLYNEQSETYTFDFYQVQHPEESDFNKGLYYIKINESIDSSVWLGYVQATGQYDAQSTYYTYSLNNGVSQFVQVTEPSETDFNAGKYFVQRVYGPDDKTIVEALNELAQRLNLDQIDLDGRVTQLRQEVNQLEQQVVIQETPIGSIETKDLSPQDIYENPEDPDDSRNGLPTDAYLDSYVYEQVSRSPENGDVIFVTENIPTATDEIYKFIFSGNTWTFYQIPGVQSATNDAKGIVKGTYVANFVGLTQPVIVDIEDGEIANIYIKTASSYKALKTYIDEDSGKIDNILVNSVLQTITNKSVNILLKTINGTAIEGSGDIVISVPIKAMALGSTDLTPDINGKITIPTVTPDLVPYVDADTMTDTTPTENSTNWITSGAVYSGLATKINEPSVAGTNGQILTSDGQGGSSWEDPVEAPIQSIDLGITNLPPDSNGKVTIPAASSSTIGIEEASEVEVVTSVSSSSTDSQIPTAKAVYENQPDLSGYVDLASAQTITGVKTFTNDITMTPNKKIKGSNGSSYISMGGTNYPLVLYGGSNYGVQFANYIYPTSNATTDIGARYTRWRDLYLSRNLTDGTNSISVANIQPKTDANLTTTATTITGAINEVNSVAKGCNKAEAYADYSALITALNSASATDYNVGQSFYIQTLDVPDLWIMSIESSSVAYTYVDDATFVTATGASGGVQVGYYKLAQLETLKQDLSNYATQSDLTTGLNGCVKTTGAQAINGEKRFNSALRVGLTTGITMNNNEGSVVPIIISDSTSRDLILSAPLSTSKIELGNTTKPKTNNTYDLGDSTYKWKDLYLSGNLTDGTTSVKVADLKTKVDTTSTSPITLANNTSFRLGTISALTINNPSSYELDFECEVIFTADSTISMTYSAVAPTWSGDDVAGGIFTPQANKTYNILFFNNGTSVGSPSIQAIVRGV